MTVYIPLLPHTLPIGLAKQTQTKKKVEIYRNIQEKKKKKTTTTTTKRRWGVVVIIVVPPKPSNTTPNPKINKIVTRSVK
jgi:hypothetical protein